MFHSNVNTLARTRLKFKDSLIRLLQAMALNNLVAAVRDSDAKVPTVAALEPPPLCPARALALATCRALHGLLQPRVLVFYVFTV